MNIFNFALQRDIRPLDAAHKRGGNPAVIKYAAYRRPSDIRMLARWFFLPVLLVIFNAGRNTAVIPAGATQDPRTLRVTSVGDATSGRIARVPIQLIAQGDEHSLSFSLSFNPQ